MLYWDSVENAMDKYTIICLGVLGVICIFAFKYKMKIALSSLASDEKSLSTTTKLGVYSLLFYPLAGAIFFIVLFTTNNSNNPLSDENSNIINETSINNTSKQATSFPVKDSNLVAEKSVPSALNSTKFEWFIPDLSHVAPMKEQFLEQAFASLDPRKDLTESELKKTQQIVEKLVPLLKKKKWDELVNFVENDADDPVEAANILINVAANFDAPDELFTTLANNGGELIPTALLTLVQKDRSDTVIKLENYGATLNSEVLKDTNVLHFAMLSPLSPKSFEFLIDKVDIIDNVGQLGVDIVGLSIINADTNADYISYYLDQLIVRGASIKPQHVELMKGLRKDNAVIYEEIIEVTPELSVN